MINCYQKEVNDYIIIEKKVIYTNFFKRLKILTIGVM